MKRLLLLIALPLLLAACTGNYEADTPYRPPGIAKVGQPGSGEDFYLRDCAWCHGASGEGTGRGPDITTGTNGEAMYHFMLTTGRMPIDHPLEPTRRSPTIYSDEEIVAIVTFMEKFDAPGPDIPEVDLDADLTRGLTLYQENCAACHSTTGIGGALTPGRALNEEGGAVGPTSVVAPSLHESSPIEIAEATRVGPGTMPVFAEETMSDEDLSALTRYVLYLQNPRDPGGAPVGRVGPVVEGAIGWIVGVGILVIFIRWIGTKRGEP